MSHDQRSAIERRGDNGLVPTSGAHEIAYQELCALLARHAGNLSAMDMLAVAANVVGKLVAMQDQRMVTPEMAMQVVADNIEYGNKTVLAKLIAARSAGSG